MASILISVVSLLVSGTVAWLTLFRRGAVKMTQPTVIFFGPDTPRDRKEDPLPKIFLRTLLVATAKRGRVIESMHVALSRNETHQNFNIWVYGDDKLVRGSGLFVGETGVAANHHFLAPNDGGSFAFTEGRYKLEVPRRQKPKTALRRDFGNLPRHRRVACRAGNRSVFRLGAGFRALPAAH